MPGSRARRTAAAMLGDLVLLVAFAALGRRAHDEDGSAVAQTFTIAAPFLIGYAVAGVSLRLDRDPFSLRRGTGVWALGLGLGLLLRGTAFDRGLAPAFVVVAVLVTGALLVGWRAVIARGRRLQEDRRPA